MPPQGSVVATPHSHKAEGLKPTPQVRLVLPVRLTERGVEVPFFTLNDATVSTGRSTIHMANCHSVSTRNEIPRYAPESASFGLREEARISQMPLRQRSIVRLDSIKIMSIDGRPPVDTVESFCLDRPYAVLVLQHPLDE